VRRELREELGTESEVGALVATVENLFTYEGVAGHEIVLVYECALRNERLYSVDAWDAQETTPAGVVTHAVAWRSVHSFGAGGDTLYPEELVHILSS
jgi:hypothetical protein